MDVVVSNVSQLQVPVYAGPQRQSIGSTEIKAEFLQLKALNKHAHLRVSPYPLDSKAFEAPACLFTVGTSKGLFAAVIRTASHSTTNQFAIAAGTLSSLRQTFATGKAEDGFIPYTPQKTFDCAGKKPIIVKFAANDDRLVVALERGPVLVFDVNAFLNSEERPTPLVFPSEDYGHPRSVHPNPGDHPELVAVMRGLYGQDRGIYVEVLDVINHKIVGGWYSEGNLDAMPISVSWSPRGKQIAIGNHKGELLLFTPLDTSMAGLKGHIPRSANPALDECVISSTTWLANSLFHVIYAPPQAVARYDAESVDAPDQMHLIIQHDKHVQGEIMLENPCMPFGAKRLPGPMNVVLKNWGKVKYLLFAGDGPASDIGAIGCVADQWGNLALEETSRPALPLTADMDESALFGLELDLTSSEPLDMSEQPGDDLPQLPPAPILMAYTSEGALVAWHVIAQSEGAYPGMVSVQESNAMSAQPPPPPAVTMEATPIQSPFTQQPVASTAPISTSPFGAPQPGGAFGSVPTPTFGAVSFGGATAPTFGSPSLGNTTTPSTTSSLSAGSGFSAFAGNKPVGFGSAAPTTQSPFAAAAASAAATSAQASPSNTASTAPTAFGSGTQPTFGQPSFGFGSAGSTFGQTGFGFGQPKPAPGSATTPSTGSAFSAFSNKPSSFGPQAPTPSAQSAQLTFGGASAPTFGSAPSPASTSGQTSFGQPAQPAAPIPAPIVAPTGGGGFAGFADKAGSFGAPVAAPSTGSGDAAKPSPAAAPPQPSAFSAFSKPGTGAFGAFGAGKDRQPSVFELAAAGASTSQAKDSVASAGFGKPTGFGLGNPPVGGSAATTFGQPSILGFGVKPSGTEETKAAPPITIPSGGGFASFGASGGFSSFAGKGTSPFANASEGSKTPGKEDAAKNIFSTPSSKPSQPFSAVGLGRGLSKADDDDDDEPTQKEAFPEDEIDNKEPTKGDDTGLDFGSLGIAKSTGVPSLLAKAVPGSSATPATPAKSDVVPQSSPSKTPATPSTHGTFSSPAVDSAFVTPAKDTTPSPSPTKTPATPVSGFGAFSKLSSGFGAFGGTPSIANAFSQSPSTPKVDSSSTPMPAPEAATAQSVFGQSSLFGGGSVFGQTSTLGGNTVGKAVAPNTTSPFSAFATPGKPSPFGQIPEKKNDDEGSTKDGSASTAAESPSLLSRLGPTPAKSPSLLDRMGPPPPSKVEPLPPDSDEGEEDFDDDGEEIDFPEGEGEEDEEYSSEQEYEPEEGEEEEDDDESREAPAQCAFGKSPAKAKSEEPVSAFKLPALPTKFDSTKAASEPPSLATEKTPSKPFGLGRPTSVLSGTPVRSSPLASNPPVTAGEEVGGSGSSKLAQPKPAIDLSLPAKPTFSPFPAFGTPSAEAEKKPSLFSAMPPPTSPNPMLALRSTAPSSSPLAPAAFSGSKPSLPATTPPSSALPMKPFSAPADKQPASEPSETPLQQQFVEIYMQMSRDLEQLSANAKKCAQQRVELAQPRGGRTVDDLASLDKWGIGDMVALQQILRNFDRETNTLKDQSFGISKSFAELQSLQLQAEVKKEEMLRYSRAAKDPEFQQMISVRGLGPEQEESQTKLRKQMQSVGDRMQQLEETFENQRKRLEMHRSGRFRIEAPTLDTINRTCRNIDVALEQRSTEVTRLAMRVDELRLTTTSAASSPKSQEKKAQRAADAAYARAADAALGAEHGAARLKALLSRARTEPRLSVASDAPPVQKLSRPAPAPAPAVVTPSAGPAFAFPKTPPPALPAFDWPKHTPSPSPKESGSSGKRTSRHQSSVKLPTGNKESPNPSVKAAASFDWGPLQDFSPGKK